MKFQNNRITEISSGTFKDVTVNDIIDLTYNQISVVYGDAFVNIRGKPEKMTLNNNPIHIIETNAFRQLDVKRLYLQDLKIDHLEYNTFEDVTAVEINLTKNKIKSLAAAVFTGTNTLQNLYLDNVGLKAVYGTLFKDASTVSGTISLEGNELNQLPGDFLSQVSPYEIKLASNKISVFPKDMIQNTKVKRM
ncbi:reticulon-4 receptor-like [Gigantopelta aegis]|uniref:reticulon-4 receptor-like n=1 Tax=Gigantopelta aegis TaxID=1735272 RepID=UPI001B88D01F|nr:reticulon-4 receptor-like [Gigantopelta aegis]